jgi:Na+-transporting methylmalonyl-CoA/oxaloacetate decarboxylase gamma subunit
MYLVAIAWIYVVLMMTAVEATSKNGTVLGALVTLVLYGALPLGLVMYLMGAPLRSRRRKALEAQETVDAAQAVQAAQPIPQSAAHAPDAGGEAACPAHATADAGAPVAPVRKEA